jgi:hypothetical protein
MPTALWIAQDKLKEAIRSRANLDRVAVGLGEPTRYEDDHIWISGEVPSWSQQFMDSAATAKDEQFTLEINVLVSRSTQEYVVVRDRVKYLCDEIEEALVSDLFLDSTVEFAQIIEGRVDEFVSDERKRGLLVSLMVEIRTHLV